MSSINNYRETGPEDYLNALRKQQQAAKAGNTSANNLTTSPVIPVASNFTVGTTVEIDANKNEVESNVTVESNLMPIIANGDTFRWGRGLQTYRQPCENGKNRWFAGGNVDGRAQIFWGFFSW